MARANLREREKKAAAARARMARRAKRTRFLKENKKRIIILFLCFLVVVFLAFFTPWGPDYYYSDIQITKMQDAGTVTPGAIERLYKLGRFYGYTFRKPKAQEMYNEIAVAFYGFKLQEYAQNPDRANEKRFQAQRAIAKDLSKGPPFKVSPLDVPYVGYAIVAMADILMESGPKDFPRKLYHNLYMEDFYVEHPEACDPALTEHASKTRDRLFGRR